MFTILFQITIDIKILLLDVNDNAPVFLKNQYSAQISEVSDNYYLFTWHIHVCCGSMTCLTMSRYKNKVTVHPFYFNLSIILPFLLFTNLLFYLFYYFTSPIVSNLLFYPFYYTLCTFYSTYFLFLHCV